MTSNLSEAMATIVKVLEPFSPDERRRVVSASLMLLGDDSAPVGVPNDGQHSNLLNQSGSGDFSDLSPKATRWLEKSGLTRDELDEWLHIESESVQPLALPGNASKRNQQVLHTYLIKGAAAFIETDEACFSDKDARDLCEHFGCYDSTNHAKALKAFGNKIAGSKSAGWKLTAPGLAAAAELLKGGETA